jgi:DNA-binding NtrC family response regulator
LTEDEGVRQFFAEISSAALQVFPVTSATEAVNKAKNNPRAIFVIDYDLKAKNGLEVFKMLKAHVPEVKVIMLSAANSVPLAVSATKKGVDEFLRKPLQKDEFLKVLRDLSAATATSAFCVPEAAGFEWLLGKSQVLEKCLTEAEQFLKGFSDIVLVAEPGIDSAGFAAVLHQNGRLSKRKLVSLDLLAFQKEVDEAHFWTMLQKLLTAKENSFELEEDLCGTLLLFNFDLLEFHFKHSILDFLKNKTQRLGAEKLDRQIRVVVAVAGAGALVPFEEEGLLESFTVLTLPPLRERKDDLPVIFAAYLEKYNRFYAKSIKYVAADCLNLLFYFDFGGNYSELESLVAAAVLRSQGEAVGIREFPLTTENLEKVVLNRLAAKHEFSLNVAHREFEEVLFKTVFEKTAANLDATARFLSVSRLFLEEKLT